jgi:membrane protein DedA with SNARE-associated domain
MTQTCEKESCCGSIIWGIIVMGIGVVLLLSNLRVIPDFEDTWPLILVIIGIALIISAVFKRSQIKKKEERGPHNP